MRLVCALLVASCSSESPAPPAIGQCAPSTSVARQLARRYEQGLAIPRDRSRGSGSLSADAVAIYFDRCVWSAEPWCATLWFEVVHKVSGVEDDMLQARTIYAAGCVAGDVASCGGLGWILGFRYSSLPDERAAGLLEQACNRGHLASCRNLATSLRPDTLLLVSDDARVQRVARLYADACTAGDLEACTATADRIHDRRGPPAMGDADAVRLFRRSCAGGDPVACRGLADLERDGWGMPRDERAAELHYRFACDRHEMRACFDLGRLLAKRPGSDLDPRPAELMKRACAARLLEACPTP